MGVIMAILKGFPPSNTISPGPKLPTQCKKCGIEEYGQKYIHEKISENEDRFYFLCMTCVNKSQEQKQLEFNWEE